MKLKTYLKHEGKVTKANLVKMIRLMITQLSKDALTQLITNRN